MFAEQTATELAIEELRAFGRRAYEHAGLTAEDARTVADVQLEADLRGVHTHGFQRLPWYVERLLKGENNPRPQLRVRLIGVACLPLPDVEEAIAELQRVAKMGIRGAAIPCTAPVDKPYSDPAYEPFWNAAEEVGLPITMHIFCGSTWDMGLPAHWGNAGTSIVGYAMAHGAIASTLAQLICGGVCERHRKLRFVAAEWETGWFAHFLVRLDHAAYRARHEASPDLKTEPSAYFHRQCYITFEDDEIGVRTRDIIGVDNLLWGNDYPHHDSIWPRSMEVLDRIMESVPDDEKEQMTSGGVLRLYDIKLPAELGV